MIKLVLAIGLLFNITTIVHGNDADYFPLDVGNRWVYKTDREGDMRVEIVDCEKTEWGEGYGFKVMLNNKITQKKYYSKKDNGIVAYRGILAEGNSEGFIFNPPLAWLSYPLFSGKQWSQRLKQEDKGEEYPAVFDVEISGEVLGKEFVRVPAGRFLCYKVEIKEKFNDHIVCLILWYSQDIGMVKEHFFAYRGMDKEDITLELKSYSLATKNKIRSKKKL
jgi:hypothetical protein